MTFVGFRVRNNVRNTLFIWHTGVTSPQPPLSAIEINPCSVFRKQSYFWHTEAQLKLLKESDFNIANVCFLFLRTQTAFWRGLIDSVLPISFNHTLHGLGWGWPQFSRVTYDLGCFASITDSTSVKINSKLNHCRQWPVKEWLWAGRGIEFVYFKIKEKLKKKKSSGHVVKVLVYTECTSASCITLSLWLGHSIGHFWEVSINVVHSTAWLSPITPAFRQLTPTQRISRLERPLRSPVPTPTHPPCPLTMYLSTPSPWFLNATSGGDSTTPQAARPTDFRFLHVLFNICSVSPQTPAGQQSDSNSPQQCLSISVSQIMG